MTASMTACADCGAPVAVDATSCPSCGRVTVLGALAMPRRWEADALVPADAPVMRWSTTTDAAAEPAVEPSPARTSVADSSVAVAGADADASVAASATEAAAGPAFAAALDPARTDVAVTLPAGAPIPPTGAYGPGQRFAAEAAAAAAETRASAPAAAAAPRDVAARDRLLLERAVGVAAGIVVVGMVLPWGAVVVGAPGVGTTLGTIGVLGSWHVLALLATLGVAGLALAGQRVPDRVRLGVLPLALGAFFLGLVWPYLLGPIGGGPGPAVILAGSVVLAGCALTTLLLDGRRTA